MGSPLITPRFFWVTQAGAPAVGYQLSSFAAGTATPQATYPTAADADAGTNANANPVVLDALGSANVFLSQLPYKFVLKDSLLNTIWTEDNVNQSGVAGFQSSADINTSIGFQLADNVEATLGLTAQAPTVTCDPKTEFSQATGRFTAKAAGTYLAICTAAFGSGGVTFRANNEPYILLRKNGAGIHQSLPGTLWATGNKQFGATANAIYTLAVNDYITAHAAAGFTAGIPTVSYSISIVRIY